MPMIDRFPGLLRERLEVAYEEDLDNVFDVGSVRAALEAQKDELDHELRRVSSQNQYPFSRPESLRQNYLMIFI